jgi:hypothetical protein
MASKTPLIAGSLMIVGVAVAVVIAIALAEPAPTSTIRFSGSEASLKVLSAQAQRCGISHAKLESIDTSFALSVKASGSSDTSFKCLVAWVVAHPESKIGFLGNQEAKP